MNSKILFLAMVLGMSVACSSRQEESQKKKPTTHETSTLRETPDSNPPPVVEGTPVLTSEPTPVPTPANTAPELTQLEPVELFVGDTVTFTLSAIDDSTSAENIDVAYSCDNYLSRSGMLGWESPRVWKWNTQGAIPGSYAVVFVARDAHRGESAPVVGKVILKSERERPVDLNVVESEFLAEAQAAGSSGRATLQALAEGVSVPVSNLPRLAKAVVAQEALVLRGATVTDLSLLAPLQQLRSLDLTGTAVASLAPLQGLKRLESLAFHGVEALSLKGFEALSQIRILDVSGANVGDLVWAQGLLSLETLDLSKANVTSLKALSSLPRLAVLSLRGVTTLSSAEELSTLQRLVKLSLDGMTIAGNPLDTLAPLASLEHLEDLGASGNGIKNLEPLRGKPLRQLRLNDNHIVSLDPLAGNTVLRVLDVRNNQLSDVAAVEGMTSLWRLNFSGNRAVSKLPSFSGTLGVDFLAFSNTSVTDISSLWKSKRPGSQQYALAKLRSLDMYTNTKFETIQGLEAFFWLARIRVNPASAEGFEQLNLRAVWDYSAPR